MRKDQEGSFGFELSDDMKDRDHNDEEYFPEPVEMPIEPEIDLHTFHPSDVKDVVEEYLYQCHIREFSKVRIVHGKGRQVLRKIVISVLEKNPYVESYAVAPAELGGHGATVVILRPTGT